MSDRSQIELKRLNKVQKKGRAVPSAPYMPITAEMLESPAYTTLSYAANKCLWRICITHTQHARSENGRLGVTFDQFEAYGVSRKQIRPALDELDALGLVKLMREGRKAYGNVPGAAAEYRLTFEGTVRGENPGKPTDEWRSIKTVEQARAIVANLSAKRARKDSSNVVLFRRAA